MHRNENATSFRPHRYRGVLTGAIMGLSAAVLFSLGLALPLAITMLIVSILLLVTAILFHGCHGHLTAFLERIGTVLATSLVILISALVYYSVITPVALTNRVFGRDELKLRKVGANSNWYPTDNDSTSDDYFRRQY